MEVFKVFATLGLDSAEFNQGLDSAQAKMQAAGESMGRTGRQLTTRVSLPLAAIGAGAIKAGADFETSMNQVAAVSGATGDEFDALRDQAKDLGATTQFSASQAADAMGFLAMAGMDADGILAAMPQTLELAAAGQMSLADAADTVTNVMAGYGLEADQLGRVVDALTQAFTSSNTDLNQLGQAMKFAGPIAASAGVGFDEAAAAIGLMGNAGIQGSMAGTSLRGAISRMLNPTASASNVMRDLGVSFTDAEGRLRPLDEIIQDLEPHAENTGAFMELFGQRAGPAMAALVSQGSSALTDLTHELENSAGRGAEVAAAQMEGFNGSMKLLKSAIEALMIAIADSGLLEFMTDLVTGFAQWVQKLSETNPGLLKMLTVVGGILAALGPFLMILGSVVGTIGKLAPLLKLVGPLLTVLKVAFAALTGPIGIVVAVVGALVYAFTTDFLGIRTKTVEAAKAIWGAMKSLGGWIADTVGSITKTFSNWGASIRDKAAEIGGHLLDFGRRAKDGLVDHFRGLTRLTGQIFTGDFAGAFQTAKDILKNFWDTINDLFGDLPRKMLQFGKDMIMGLVDGLKSMVTNAVDAVKGVGSSIISGFKGLLGIESPSKVFHGFGIEIGQGLADGIDEGAPLAVNAMTRLANQVSSIGGAIVSGVWDDANVVAGVVGALEGQEAMTAIKERLETLSKTRLGLASQVSSPGVKDYQRSFIDAEVKALRLELKNLRADLRVSAKANARSGEVQTERFARSVATFDTGVRGLALSNQRY